MHTKLYSEKQKTGEKFEDLGVDGRIILTSKRKRAKVWTKTKTVVHEV
jgi:hypothetical protein